MPSTFSTNLNLELQATGDHSGTWGTVLNNNALNIIDTSLGGAQTFSLSSSNITVTTTQSQNNTFLLIGALTADVSITWPAIGRTYFISNQTTGGHVVTLKAGTGNTPQVIPQGAAGFFTLNVNDILIPSLPGVPIGAVSAFAMQTPPTGWLECDGSAISRTTYSSLFGLIGTTYGSGDGVTTFNIPDMRGYFARGWDHGRGVDPARAFGTNQSSANLTHNHSFNGDAMPPHSHTFNVSTGDSPDIIAAGGPNIPANTTVVSGTSAGTPTGTIGSSGGTESRPVNIAILYAIRVL